MNRYAAILAALTMLPVTPVTAMVVVEEDFEDDVVVEDTFIIDGNGDQVFVKHQQNGPPVNPGNAGTWMPNQYDVNRMGFTGSGGEWFDPSDVNPDTNWQMAVIKDFRKIITLPPLEGENRDTRIPERDGQEGFIISHHQGDCGGSAPCDVPGQVGFTSIRLNRGGFIKFAEADGTPQTAGPGDVVRGRFDFVAVGGNTAFALTNDIDAMVARTADEDLNPPYSKWNVGFGEAFVPLQPDLGGWQGHIMDPYVVAQLEFISGFNQEYLGSRVATFDAQQCIDTGSVNCSANIELVPDHDLCAQSLIDIGQCGPTTDPNFTRPTLDDDYTRYQTLEFEYTVGDTIWKLWLDGVEVSTQFDEACPTCPGKEIDQEYGQPVPVGQPVPPEGTQQINGVIFGATGDRDSYGGNKNSTALVVDDLCFTINQELEGACFGGGVQPLLGDANNDNQVTGADLISVQQNFGKDYTNGACDGMGLGDANDDCLVTGADLISVQQNFGKTAAAAVPEPATAALVGLLLWLGWYPVRPPR